MEKVRLSLSYEFSDSMFEAVQSQALQETVVFNELSVDIGKIIESPSVNDDMSISLSIKFNANSIHFKVQDFNADPDCMLIKEKILKIQDVEDELQLYIGIVSGLSSMARVQGYDQADVMRRDAHNALASFIEDNILDELAVHISTDSPKPTAFAKQIVTTWLSFKGYGEETGRGKPFRNTGSASKFYEDYKAERLFCLGR